MCGKSSQELNGTKACSLYRNYCKYVLIIFLIRDKKTWGMVSHDNVVQENDLVGLLCLPKVLHGIISFQDLHNRSS